MKLNRSSTSAGDAINLTPLIDIVFLLLIFFMVTAVFKEDDLEMQVTLPESEHAKELSDLPEIIEVVVNAEGRFQVLGRNHNREELKRKLERAKRNNKKTRVVIKADREVAMKHPVQILDLCAGLGIPTSIASAAKTVK